MKILTDLNIKKINNKTEILGDGDSQITMYSSPARI